MVPRDLIKPLLTDLVFDLAISYIYTALFDFYKHFHHLTNFGVSLFLLVLAFIRFNTDSNYHYRNFLFGSSFLFWRWLLRNIRIGFSHDLSSVEMGDWPGNSRFDSVNCYFCGTDLIIYPSTLLSPVRFFSWSNRTNIDIDFGHLNQRYATMVISSSYYLHFKVDMPQNTLFIVWLFIIFLLSYLLSIAQKTIRPRLISALPAPIDVANRAYPRFDSNKNNREYCLLFLNLSQVQQTSQPFQNCQSGLRLLYSSVKGWVKVVTDGRGA